MDEYVIVTDSTADLPKSILDEFGISVVPMKFTVNGKTYADGDMNSHEFYSSLKTFEQLPTTTQINPQEYSDFFEEFLKKDQNVLYVCFSSGLSGSYNSACIAANELCDKYNSKVKVVDSRGASMGEGFLVYKLALKKQSGLSFDDAVKWAEDYKMKITHIFTVDDLNHLARSGRLSKTSAFFGGMMNIKPVLHVDEDGKLILIDKIRGRGKALDLMVDKFEQCSEGVENDFIMISHGDCFEDAKKLAEKIKEKFGIKNIIFGNITPMIGTHTGLGTLSIFFEGNCR